MEKQRETFISDCAHTAQGVVEMTNAKIKFGRPFMNAVCGTRFSEVTDAAFTGNIKFFHRQIGRGPSFAETSRNMSLIEPCDVSQVNDLDEKTESVLVMSFKEHPDKTTTVSKLVDYGNCLQSGEDEDNREEPRYLKTFHGGSSRSESTGTTVTENMDLMSGAASPVASQREVPPPDPGDIMYVNNPIETPESDVSMPLEDVPRSNSVTTLRNDHEKASSDEDAGAETIDAIPFNKIKELSLQKRDRYKCHQCGKNFNRSGALSTHIKTHSTVRLFHCAECGKSFKRSDHLNQHFRSHENTNPLNCSECGKRFKHSGAVVSHMRSHIVIGHFVCMECNREFKLHRYLILHMQGHVQPEFIECGQFDRVDPKYYNEYFVSQNLKHEKFVCDECGKRFKNPGALRMHMTVHTSSRPFECNMCGKTFKDMPHLDQHMQVHTKCESLVCVECGKSFKNPRILATHIKIHSNDRPFECAGCGKTFKRSDHLTQHMRVHADEQRHVCAECGSAFDVPELLFKHMVSSHANQSEVVEPSENHGGQLMQLVAKRFECVDCGESFPLRVALVKHRKVHTKQELLECSECGKNFKHLGALNTHMKFHAKSRPFQCTECKKSFIIPNHLSRHMQAHYTRHMNRQGVEVNVKEEDPDNSDSETSPE